MLRLLADANIPHALSAFGALGDVRTLPGRSITSGYLKDVDALLVRSVTRVDAALLDGTPVRFVGTATAGIDHVDTAALAERGIAFASAPGSNAASVVDYVLAALLAVAVERGEGVEGTTLGVVGAGEVGGRLVPRAQALGVDVMVCDPPRADAGHTDHDYRSLRDVLRHSDVVSLHTPLLDGGPYPTRGLVCAEGAALMKRDAVLVNAARGAIVTADAALALARSRPVVLDVWPSEPTPDPVLVDAVRLGTPHIAGYATDAKVRGTAMVADALRQWQAGKTLPPWDADVLEHPGPLVAPDLPVTSAADRAAWLDALVRQAYDIRRDDARFRAALAGVAGQGRAEAFGRLRAAYPQRRELSRARVEGTVPGVLRNAVESGLGMGVSPPSAGGGRSA